MRLPTVHRDESGEIDERERERGHRHSRERATHMTPLGESRARGGPRLCAIVHTVLDGPMLHAQSPRSRIGLSPGASRCVLAWDMAWERVRWRLRHTVISVVNAEPQPRKKRGGTTRVSQQPLPMPP